MQATLSHPRPVLRRGNRRSNLIRPRAAVAGLIGRAKARLFDLAERARRPVLYLGSMAAVCHGAWQIWEPLGWFGMALCGLVVERLTGPDPRTEQLP